jgi:soluble lytic murein transglycosylase-like protein
VRFWSAIFLGISSWLFGQEMIKYQGLINKVCKEEGIPSFILTGLIWVESKGDPLCVSSRRANGGRDEGIAQLNSTYLSYFTWFYNKNVPIDPFNPASAIPIAARILKHNKIHFENWPEAIAAYRQGITGVEKNGITHISALYVARIYEFSFGRKEE